MFRVKYLYCGVDGVRLLSAIDRRSGPTMLFCSRFGCRQKALGFQPEIAVRKVWFWAIGDLRLMGFAATRTIVLHATLPDLLAYSHGSDRARRQAPPSGGKRSCRPCLAPERRGRRIKEAGYSAAA
ncbi:hypothetical protein X726_32600 [Mesorhizobium sp. L103C105A0]|nr:hypothetical protein X726_32600 [Mesorhizobium sp. L103C105A0]